MEASRQQATELEHQRDARSRAADELIEQHHEFAIAVALFQIAIALGAIAALTKVRLMWIASVIVGASGVIALLLPVVRTH